MAYAFLDQYYSEGSNADLAKIIERTITEVVIPDGVKRIGSNAFANHYALKKITLPEGLEIIQYDALAWTSIEELTLPLSCHTLEEGALLGLWYAKTIKLGNVKSIGSRALAQQNWCVEYDFTACDSVPTLENTNAFDDYALKNNPKMLVPAALYGEWIVATNWAEYASYIVPVEQVPSVETPDYVSEDLVIEHGVLTGRGECADSVIVVPEDVTEIAFECFKDDELIDTLILPESGCYLNGYVGAHSSLRVIKNYFDMGMSFGLSTADSLELISVIGSSDINNYQFYGLPKGICYDFSRCESVPQLAFVDCITVGKGTKIYVPLELYDEWIATTNWTEIAEYIVVAR